MEHEGSDPQTQEAFGFPLGSMTEVLLSKWTRTRRGSHRSLHLEAEDETQENEMNRAEDFPDSGDFAVSGAPFGCAWKEPKKVSIEHLSGMKSSSLSK